MTDTLMLLSLAHAMRTEGRLGDAAILFDSVLSLHPDNLDVLRGLVATLNAKGDALAALKRLLAARAAYADMTVFLADVRQQVVATIMAFNRLMQAGQVKDAEPYAAALANLHPDNLQMLGAALSCNQALGDAARASQYAARIVAVDPANMAAHVILAEHGKQTDDAVLEIRHRLFLALSPENRIEPLVRLHCLVEIAGLILCQPYERRSRDQLQAILDFAPSIVIEEIADTPAKAWEIYYRLILDAIDLAALENVDGFEGPGTAVAFTDAEGRALALRDVVGRAERLKAQVVFFAAADEDYMKLYGRPYTASVLKYCDVDCLVILHVSGGASVLSRVVEAVGIGDERLIFARDVEEDTSLAAKTVDSPRKPTSPKPLAYLQSIRFLKLEFLLKSLKRPIFVSDIDLLLQRGVEDLLLSSYDADVVFNENRQNKQVMARFTANLLLVNPTRNAAFLLRFLKSTLETALRKPEVTRWIDQIALLLGHHALTLARPAANVQYFDTASDINNVIYPSFQPHPFRFLSLYHGFDLSSLDEDLRPAAERVGPTDARQE